MIGVPTVLFRIIIWLHIEGGITDELFWTTQ